MNTRPTTDKVKEAIFSMIGPYFESGSVLDLFAGTGGLGIEALSRGMDKAVFIDASKASVDIVKENLKAANLAEQAEVYRNDAGRALKVMAKRGLAFDLVFLDPPYRLKTIADLIVQLQEFGLLADNAVVVAEHDAGDAYPDRIGQAVCIKRANYGDTSVSIYKLEQTNPGQPENNAAGRDAQTE